MIKSFLSFLASVFWLIVRREKKRDDPNAQLEMAKDENSQIIESDNADALNARLDRDTGRLPGSKS